MSGVGSLTNNPNRPVALNERPVALNETDANSKVIASQKRVADAEREAEQSLTHTRQEHQRVTESENAKQESSLEAQQIKGYERIRDLKRTQQAELNRTRHDGETELTKLRDYYRNAIFRARGKAQEDLDELNVLSNRRIEYETKSHNIETEDLKNQQHQQIQILRDLTEGQVDDMKRATQKEVSRMKTQSEELQEIEQKHFDDQHTKIFNEHGGILNRIGNNASQQLHKIRRDTADKLAAYESRQNDPFYKLLKLDAQIEETEDGFRLTAKIPEHEQERVLVALKGDNIVISGHRQNEETLNLGQGHTQSSASFQSYHESFPLSWPVDGTKLSKKFQADQLIVTVPKKNQYAHPPQKPVTPERVRLEPPRFPKNIPHLRQDGREDGDSSLNEVGNSGSKPLL